MSLLTTSSITAIDSTKIAKGDFIRAKYSAWKQAHNGIVAKVTAEEIRVLYIGDGGNVTNYFTITADEIREGLWEIAWSANFSAIERQPEAQEEGETS